LKLYQRRALRPDLFLSVHQHVTACPSCSEQCKATSRIKEDYAALLEALMPAPDDEPYHLTKAELTGYLKRSLDEIATESAQSHLTVCPECARALEGLRAEMARNSLAPGAKPIGVEEDGRPSRQARAGLIGFPAAWHRPVQYISLVLLALGLILTTLLFIRTRESGPAQPSAHQAASPPLPVNRRETLPSSGDPGANGNERGADNGGRQIAAKIEQEPGPVASLKGPSNSREGGRSFGAESESDIAAAAMLPPASRRAIKSALTAQRLERPRVLDELRGVSSILLSESGDGRPFLLLSPVGEVVQSSSPTLRWKPLARASTYVVTVTDDKLDEVAISGPLTKTEWRLPLPLQRGGVYSWQVTAFRDGQAITSPVMPAPEAKFMILDQTRHAELKRLRRIAPRYHLGLGVLYAQAGLLNEAEREFQAALKSNPGSITVRKLLRSLRAMRR